jgi:protein SCO1/2
MHGRSFATLAAAALALACSREPEPPKQGVIQLSEQFTGDFALVDQDGRRVADEDFRGKVAVVYFGFATCPDVCPMALSRLSAALNELGEKKAERVAPIFITVDPERDTPEQLSEFLAFDERMTGLTGSAAEIEAAKAAFKVYAQKQRLEDSALGYTVNHSSFFYLVDPKGQPRVAIDDSLTAEELASVLGRALRGRY